MSHILRGFLPFLIAITVGTGYSQNAVTYRQEWRDFDVAELRNIRVHFGVGNLAFSVGEVSYIFSPRGESFSGANNLTASLALLTELRRVKSFKAQVSIPSAETKEYYLSDLVISYENLK